MTAIINNKLSSRAAMYPINPSRGMLPIKGGTFDRTIIEDEINNAEIIIVSDVRLAMRSIVKRIGSSPICSNSILNRPFLNSLTTIPIS